MLSKNLFKQIRRVSTFNVGNVTEHIIERNDYPLDFCTDLLKNDIIAVIGYGPQGRSQALNLRDNGFNVIVGCRYGESFENAIDDNWSEDNDLFQIEEAVFHGTIIQYLLSDAGQIECWNNIQPLLDQEDLLCFSHGFGVVYPDKTGIIPPEYVDVSLIAPKGAGISVRQKFLNGKGINSSYAIRQDYSGYARDKTLALAFGIGSGHVFETTFKKEVYSDLTGERCVLMGMIQGAFSAQYKVLREKGHSPSEAYNETVEEALESLYPLISNKGMDWLYANCSTTAQRGALDWAPKFEQAIKPVVEQCYKSVEEGTEADIVIKCNSDSDYRYKLNQELDELRNQELWQIASKLRDLRA